MPIALAQNNNGIKLSAYNSAKKRFVYSLFLITNYNLQNLAIIKNDKAMINIILWLSFSISAKYGAKNRNMISAIAKVDIKVAISLVVKLKSAMMNGIRTKKLISAKKSNDNPMIILTKVKSFNKARSNVLLIVLSILLRKVFFFWTLLKYSSLDSEPASEKSTRW